MCPQLLYGSRQDASGVIKGFFPLLYNILVAPAPLAACPEYRSAVGIYCSSKAKAVSAYLESKQILPFDFARRYTGHDVSMTEITPDLLDPSRPE